MLFIGYICAVPYLIGITRRLNSNRKSSFCLQDTLALPLMTPTKHVKDFRIWELSLLRNQRMVTFFNFILEIQIDYYEYIIFIYKCYGCFVCEVCYTAVDNYLNCLPTWPSVMFFLVLYPSSTS